MDEEVKVVPPTGKLIEKCDKHGETTHYKVWGGKFCGKCIADSMMSHDHE